MDMQPTNPEEAAGEASQAMRFQVVVQPNFPLVVNEYITFMLQSKIVAT
jgi:hypothetical protein